MKSSFASSRTLLRDRRPVYPLVAKANDAINLFLRIPNLDDSQRGRQIVQRADVDQQGRQGKSAVPLASPVRRAILERLEQCPDADRTSVDVHPGGLTAAQLATELGLHVTTIRFHLDQLELAGLIESSFTRAFGVGRPRKVYAVAARERRQPPQASHMELLAGLLTTSFTSDVSPEEAGRQWVADNLTLKRTTPATSPGAWLGRVGQLIDVLGRWGYSSEVSTTNSGRSCRIDLVDCPFMDLARANPEVVCGIHHGLLTGALDQMGEDDVEVSLRPFVEPDLCHARTTTHQPFEPLTEESSDES